MTSKKKVMLEQLAKYFISIGKVPTLAEYKKDTNAPIRLFFIERYIGRWPRVVKMLEKNFPEVYEVVSEPEEVKPEPKTEPKPVTKVPAKKQEAKKDEDKKPK